MGGWQALNGTEPWIRQEHPAIFVQPGCSCGCASVIGQPGSLAAEAELGDDRAIALAVVLDEVVQLASALADEH